MYGVSKENERKFFQHILDTNGNPTSKVAKECNLEGYFNELCMKNIPKEHMVKVAKMYFDKEVKANERKKIIKWCSHNPLAFCSGTYFLLDYSACGNDEKLHNELRLLEKLIEKYFNVVYRRSYYGITELQVR